MKEKLLIVCAALLCLCVQGCTRQETGKAKEEAAPASAQQALRVSAENTDAAEPAIAAGHNGSSYVVWVVHRTEGGADVFLRKLNDDGSQAGAPVPVNPEPGTATAWRGDPPTVAVSTDGSIYVGWTGRAQEAKEHEGTKGHETNLYLSTSRDDGKTFAPPVKVNDDKKPAVHGMHSLALDKDGRVYLAWLDERNVSAGAPTAKHQGEAHKMESNREVFTAFSEDGGRTISRNQMVAREACPCCKTALVVAADGRVYIGWRQVLKGDYRHIAIASSADKGKTFAAPVIVSNDQWVIAGCPVSGPALSVGDNGTLRVLWYTEGEAGAQGLYLAESRDGGQTFGARQLVSKGAVRGNPLLMAESPQHTLALWETKEGGAAGLQRAEIASDGAAKNITLLADKGELPSATVAKGQLIAAYISSLDKQRSIWILRWPQEGLQP